MDVLLNGNHLNQCQTDKMPSKFAQWTISMETPGVLTLNARKFVSNTSKCQSSKEKYITLFFLGNMQTKQSVVCTLWGVPRIVCYEICIEAIDVQCEHCARYLSMLVIYRRRIHIECTVIEGHIDRCDWHRMYSQWVSKTTIDR